MPAKMRLSFRVSPACHRRLSLEADKRGLSVGKAAQQIFTERVMSVELALLTEDLEEVKARLGDLGSELDAFRARFEEVINKRRTV